MGEDFPLLGHYLFPKWAPEICFQRMPLSVNDRRTVISYLSLKCCKTEPISVSRSVISPMSAFLIGVCQEWRSLLGHGRAGKKGLTDTFKYRRFGFAPFDKLHITNSKREG